MKKIKLTEQELREYTIRNNHLINKQIELEAAKNWLVNFGKYLGQKYGINVEEYKIVKNKLIKIDKPVKNEGDKTTSEEVKQNTQ